jgi:murein DD-endopeptidase MepM/ murein hydrolase activator NlpD
MITLLSWDLDLQREVQPGDRFEAVIERGVNDEGEPAGAAVLLFVGFESAERTVAAYRFAPVPDGRADFYDREGRAVRKWLLRTPVDGARLSSAFGPRRHPVLGYTRMHKGVDFAAPAGTPVIAAGDGTVVFAGRNRGYGNYVRLRHDDEHGTAYAHLSRIAPGIKPGRKVRQGELIGRVGSTGLSTGPHLHYEVLRGDEPIDPMTVKASFGSELRGGELRRFLAQRDRVDGLRRPPPGPDDRERLVADRDG